MNTEKLLLLIHASQDCIKRQLMPEHSQSKYEYLMLLRSFELLAQYLRQSEQQQQAVQATLQQVYGVPIANLEEGLQHMAQDLRQHYHADWYGYLVKLNQAELTMTHPQERTHG